MKDFALEDQAYEYYDNSQNVIKNNSTTITRAKGDDDKQHEFSESLKRIKEDVQEVYIIVHVIANLNALKKCVELSVEAITFCDNNIISQQSH
jgi:enoyl-[acyl-carrier-protein] reductase (NADH)